MQSAPLGPAALLDELLELLLDELELLAPPPLHSPILVQADQLQVEGMQMSDSFAFHLKPFSLQTSPAA